MSNLPRIEFRNEGLKPELLIDGKVMRGVTSVSMATDTRGLTTVEVSFVTDRFNSQVLAAPGARVDLDTPEAALQREVLSELRETEPCPDCGAPGALAGTNFHEDACPRA